MKPIATNIAGFKALMYLLALGGMMLSCGAAAPLLDVDFGAASRRVDAEGVGSFHGVLPPRVNENFSGWQAGRVTTEVREEGGLKFLRFTTRTGAAGGQFSIAEIGRAHV